MHLALLCIPSNPLYLKLIGPTEQAAPEKGAPGPTEIFDKEAVDKRVDEQNQVA